MTKIIKIKNFINGKYVETESYIDSYNPATNEINAYIPDSSEEHVNSAVNAAKNAFQTWSKTSVAERSKILYTVATLIEKNAEELAILESIDQGKPLWLAQTVDIPRAALNFRHFATAVQNDTDLSIIQPDSGVINYTLHEPIGVAGIITPWNLPIYLLTFKIAPALAYGNTVVAKPSEMTSVTAFKLCHLLQEAGLPDGVVNMVFGYGRTTGDLLVRNPDVRLISFTGGTVTGREISINAAPLFKKLSLEMGGKNAAIIFADVDLENNLPQIIRSSFLNSGEICLASSRVYVEKAIYNTFVQRFTDEALKLLAGNPLENSTLIGPMISKAHQQKVQNYIDVARSEGAIVNTVELKLGEQNKNGYYIAPTVITNIADSSVCMTDEIFGPVVCIVPFDAEDDVIERANNSQYGLSATVWSSSVDKIHGVAHRLKVGTVWCNCWLVRNLHMPFGGTKMSGTGREGTVDSREFFTEKKTICVKINRVS